MNNTKLCGIISKKLKGINNLLDIGCGDGFLVNCLAKKLNRKIMGLDISIKGFSKAYNQCKKFGVCNLIECIRDNAHNMKFKNNEFDAITLVYTLHHIDNPSIALKEARRVLKPNGKIVLVEYITKKRKSKCHKFMGGEVNKIMENAGFKDNIIKKLEDDIILVVSKKNNYEKSC